MIWTETGSPDFLWKMGMMVDGNSRILISPEYPIPKIFNQIRECLGAGVENTGQIKTPQSPSLVFYLRLDVRGQP